MVIVALESLYFFLFPSYHFVSHACTHMLKALALHPWLSPTHRLVYPTHPMDVLLLLPPPGLIRQPFFRRGHPTAVFCMIRFASFTLPPPPPSSFCAMTDPPSPLRIVRVPRSSADWRYGCWVWPRARAVLHYMFMSFFRFLCFHRCTSSWC